MLVWECCIDGIIYLCFQIPSKYIWIKRFQTSKSEVQATNRVSLELKQRLAMLCSSKSNALEAAMSLGLAGQSDLSLAVT